MRTLGQIVDETTAAIMSRDNNLEWFVRKIVANGLGLLVKAEWDMEDNFYVTESLAEDLEQITDLTPGDVLTIAAGNDINLDNVDFERFPAVPTLPGFTVYADDEPIAKFADEMQAHRFASNMDDYYPDREVDVRKED